MNDAFHCRGRFRLFAIKSFLDSCKPVIQMGNSIKYSRKKFDVSALIKKVIYGKIKENVLNK